MKSEIDSDFSKSAGQRIFEYVLLIIFLCVFALRVTITEGVPAQSALQPANLGGPVVSLLLSGILFLLAGTWVAFNFIRGRFRYYFSGLEVGLVLFLAAGVLAGLNAPNKRALINEMVIISWPLFAAILLTQILDSRQRIKLVLLVIGALGIVSAYHCTEQFFTGTQMTVEQYEESPESFLEPLGIEAGSFEHMLFEHRLYSRGVRGFFTTSNSAGSFAVLALFAGAALLFEKVRSFKEEQSGAKALLYSSLGVVFILFGFVIPKSKGAILAGAATIIAFLAYLRFTDWIKNNRKLILVVLLALAAGGGLLVVSYGLAHDRLPGGNSMLVRWQYWSATARMYAEHWVRGVGPGNFPYFYTQYKPAAALETVSDPHNFLLSILSQYGPVGLAGFLAMIFLPLWKIFFSRGYGRTLEPRPPVISLQRAIILVSIFAAVCLIVFRPIILPLKGSGSVAVVSYAIFVLYAAPVGAFLIGLWLLSRDGKVSKWFDSDITSAALICGLAAVLLHNLIDFAIFEPGVFMAFWLITACVIGLNRREIFQREAVIRIKGAFRAIVTVLVFGVLVYAYFAYALIPVVRTSRLQKRAFSNPSKANALLSRAMKADPLGHSAAKLNGRVYLEKHNQTDEERISILNQAAKCFITAIERNDADYKSYEYLAEVYTLLSKYSGVHNKRKYHRQAFDAAGKAVALYPGKGELRMRLARIAEKLEKKQVALEQYKKAVSIEDAYREQFRIMYPGREVFSRLGAEEYEFAKERIKKLSSSSAD